MRETCFSQKMADWRLLRLNFRLGFCSLQFFLVIMSETIYFCAFYHFFLDWQKYFLQWWIKFGFDLLIILMFVVNKLLIFNSWKSHQLNLNNHVRSVIRWNHFYKRTVQIGCMDSFALIWFVHSFHLNVLYLLIFINHLYHNSIYFAIITRGI